MLDSAVRFTFSTLGGIKVPSSENSFAAQPARI